MTISDQTPDEAEDSPALEAGEAGESADDGTEDESEALPGGRRFGTLDKIGGAVLGLALLALAALGVLFIIDRYSGTDSSETTSTTDADGGQEDTSDVAPVDVGGSGLAPLKGFSTMDGFQREDTDSGLGETLSGSNWVELQGTWGIEDGQAKIASPAEAGPSIAYLNIGTIEATYQVTMPRVEAGSGIAFRIRNAFNYWSLTAAPGAGTWSVKRVVDGNSIEIGRLGLSPSGDGTTVAVRLEEGAMTFYVDGVRQLRVQDTTLANSTRVGLIGVGAAGSEARWANLVIVGHSSSRFPVAPDSPDAQEEGGNGS